MYTVYNNVVTLKVIFKISEINIILDIAQFSKKRISYS